MIGEADRLNGTECVQRRLAHSVGVSPTGARARSPVAWIVSVEETNLGKPIDKALFGRVSESPGRNASEPIGGPDNLQTSEVEPSLFGRRQHGVSQSGWRDSSLRRGGRGSTVTRMCRATGEAVLVPSRNRGSKVGRITGDTGKSADRRDGGGRVRSSDEAGQRPWSEGTLLHTTLSSTREAGVE
jgi:hypothetical protein